MDKMITVFSAFNCYDLLGCHQVAPHSFPERFSGRFEGFEPDTMPSAREALSRVLT
jgi:hypothetical protein